MSASERGKLQTPTKLEFAGARSAAAHGHNLLLCERNTKPTYFVFFLHKMETVGLRVPGLFGALGQAAYPVALFAVRPLSQTFRLQAIRDTAPVTL